MAHPERPSTNLQDLPWPTEVSNEQIGRISALRRSGRSLAASASIVLKEETEVLAAGHSYGFSVLLDWYMKPANLVLQAEAAARSGKRSVVTNYDEENDSYIAHEPYETVAPEFIDFTVELEKQRLSKLPLPSLEVYNFALDKGSQRFHQLYDAGEAAGLDK